MATKAQIQREIDELLRIEVHMETNQGTYGDHDAMRACRTAEKQFSNREVYETVAGHRRETGPGKDRFPGTMRHIGTTRMAELRSRLDKLRAELYDN